MTGPNLREKLEALGPQIQEICSISGNAGLSLGVLQKGQVIYRANFGYRDVEAKLAPDGYTIYHLASLSKFVTSVAIADLVEQGQFSWESRIADLLPHFHQKNKNVRENANLIDLLAHRNALETRNPGSHQMHNQLLLPATDGVKVLDALNSVGQFRKDLEYNNWAYRVVDDIIKKHSFLTLEEFTRTHFFRPLGLKRTTMGWPTKVNFAKSYMCSNDGTPLQIPEASVESGSISAGAAGLKTSMNDILELYAWLLRAVEHQKRFNVTSTPNNPFKQTKTLFDSHIAKDKTACEPQWSFTEIPGEAAWIGLNNVRVDEMPLGGRGTLSSNVGYNHGNLPGALSFICLMPESQTAIVVLSNSLTFSDVPGWVGGLLLDAVMGRPGPDDFAALARKEWEAAMAKPAETAALPTRDRKPDVTMTALAEFTG